MPTLGALAGVTPAKAAREILSSSGVRAACWGAAAARLLNPAVCGEGGLEVPPGGRLWVGSGLPGRA